MQFAIIVLIITHVSRLIILIVKIKFHLFDLFIKKFLNNNFIPFEKFDTK